MVICPLADWRVMALEEAALRFAPGDFDPTLLLEAWDEAEGDADIEDDEREDEPVDTWFTAYENSWFDVIPEYQLCRCCGSLTQDGYTL